MKILKKRDPKLTNFMQETVHCFNMMELCLGNIVGRFISILSNYLKKYFFVKEIQDVHSDKKITSQSSREYTFDVVKRKDKVPYLNVKYGDFEGTRRRDRLCCCLNPER